MLVHEDKRGDELLLFWQCAGKAKQICKAIASRYTVVVVVPEVFVNFVVPSDQNTVDLVTGIGVC
jgi:hypothetical protein